MKNRSRRVVQIISSLSPGGAEMRMLELLRELQDENLDVVIFQTDPTPGPLTPHFKAAGATVHTHSMKSRAFWTTFLRECGLGRAQAFQCGTTPGGQITPFFLPLTALLGVPARSTRFHSDGLGRTRGFRARAIDAIANTFVSHFSTSITGVSPGALTYAWKKQWEKDPRASVLVAGVDLARFEQVEAAFPDRANLGLPANVKLLLHIGRGKHVKNRPRAINILAACPSDVHLAFVGTAVPEIQAECESLAADLEVVERVRYLGHRDDVAAIMASADALLLTSHYEGLPGVMMEAAAAGLPIVASDIPGPRFMAGRLPGISVVPLAAPDDEWAAAVEDALSNPRAGTGRNALAGTDFDLKTAARRYLDNWGIPSVTGR